MACVIGAIKVLGQFAFILTLKMKLIIDRNFIVDPIVLTEHSVSLSFPIARSLPDNENRIFFNFIIAEGLNDYDDNIYCAHYLIQ